MIKYSYVNYIFGSPGAGKTTVLSKIGQYFIKKFKKSHSDAKVYSNFPLKGAVFISDEDLGYWSFGEGSVILLDECGISYNNRNFKSGLMSDPQRLAYWKLVRHYKNILFLASQSWSDVDKKCRDLSTNYMLIKRSIIPGCTILKPIYKKVDIDENTHEPADFYVIDVFWNWKLIFRKRWYKYFNSFDAPELPPYPDKEVV